MQLNKRTLKIAGHSVSKMTGPLESSPKPFKRFSFLRRQLAKLTRPKSPSRKLPNRVYPFGVTCVMACLQQLPTTAGILYSIRV